MTGFFAKSMAQLLLVALLFASSGLGVQSFVLSPCSVRGERGHALAVRGRSSVSTSEFAVPKASARLTSSVHMKCPEGTAVSRRDAFGIFQNAGTHQF